ncbi:MAG TPA: copper resistance protein CopC [Actinomycetota bacterium]|nr:copper resistance protein CopC [Actinomycetota bacterium]
MRFLKLVLVAATAGAWVAGSFPAPAAAQSPPGYQSSEPGKGAMMDHPPSEVTVTFDQPLDQSSWMNVLDECGNEIDSGAATISLNEMTVDIGKTPSGMYEVVYKAVGLAGATGSSTSTFEFMVHHGKACGDGKKKGGHHHPKPGKDKDGHGGHRDDDERKGHDGHDGGGMTDHNDHSGTPGSGSTGHSGHDGMGSMDSSPGHGGGHGTGHGNHDEGDAPKPGGTGATTGDGQTLAGGTGGVPITADAEAVLIGLGLALMVGVLGGWLLRMSGSPTRAA